jgi:hypothetical protein
VLSSGVAKSKKGARHIVVGDVKYRWRANGNDGYIVLVIWPDDLPGPAIACSLDYPQIFVPLGEGRYAVTPPMVITNRIVRRVIEYAVRDRAYDPRNKGKQLDLGIADALIDLSDAIRAA